MLDILYDFVLRTSVYCSLNWERQDVEPSDPTYQLLWNEGYKEGLAEYQPLVIGAYCDGIKLGLKLRFGPLGLELMDQVRVVTDTGLLDQFLMAIGTAPDLDALRNLLPPQA